MVCHEIRLRGDDSFSYRRKKKKKNKISFVRVCGRGIFELNDTLSVYIMQWHKLALKQIHKETFH